MRISYNWLQEYIYLELSPEELAARLTMAGLEVESVAPFRDPLPQVVVGRIISLEPHPRSDRLTRVRVDTGTDLLTVVCGAGNVEAEKLVAVALPGAVLPGGDGPLEVTDILGVRSGGMLCSATELGLELCGGEDDILLLEGAVSPGESLDKVLGFSDPILTLDLTPNRADCLSVLGVALEVGAITGEEVKLPQIVIQECSRGIESRVSVAVGDTRLCPRYSTRLVEGVTVGYSPLWMQVRLLKVGVRPINNIVDITNYVMMELGQPLHAFDFNRLSGDEVIVRRARLGEKLVTLDGVERQLNPEMLVIADRAGATALAGVMGGGSTGIQPDSRDILIEAALFDRISVRRTAAGLGLFSEASHRFEKGVNPEGVLAAQDRAAGLMAEIAGGQVLSGVIDVYPEPARSRVVPIRPHRISEILGLEIPLEEVTAILQRLGFGVNKAPGFKLKVEVPLRRGDVELEEDVVEEVARLYGYEQIPATLPRGELMECREEPEQRIQEMIKEVLTAAGFYEIINYSFINPIYLQRLALPEGDYRFKAIPLENPLSEEQAVLRTTLLPGLLKTLQHNFYHQVGDQLMFELGAIYLASSLPVKEAPRERTTLGLAATGRLLAPHWAGQSPPADFFAVKGALELMFNRLGLVEVEFVAEPFPYLHPTRSAAVLIAGVKAGYLGQLNPEVAELWDISQEIIVAELDLENLINRADPVPRYSSLPRYPATLRDIAVIAPRELPAVELELCIREAGGDLVEQVVLFDVYQGGQIPPGKRSLAFAIRYRSPKKTLTDEEVNRLHQQVTLALAEKGALLRE
ncbi:MAG: phenylalanine--tRNA ligase subunit beta [Firmicutes bacterium]|nr:phenylalanine--tRNA ligase subunit beta [Bacillota bacterium]